MEWRKGINRSKSLGVSNFAGKDIAFIMALADMLVKFPGFTLLQYSRKLTSSAEYEAIDVAGFRYEIKFSTGNFLCKTDTPDPERRCFR